MGERQSHTTTPATRTHSAERGASNSPPSPKTPRSRNFSHHVSSSEFDIEVPPQTNQNRSPAKIRQRTHPKALGQLLHLPLARQTSTKFLEPIEPHRERGQPPDQDTFTRNSHIPLLNVDTLRNTPIEGFIKMVSPPFAPSYYCP